MTFPLAVLGKGSILCSQCSGILYKDNVRRAGKLIANKLGNNCFNEDFLKDKAFMLQIAEILR